jgi:hypothetical protein
MYRDGKRRTEIMNKRVKERGKAVGEKGGGKGGREE